MSKLLAFKAAAKQLGVSERTLKRWRAEGMRVTVEGRRVYVQLADAQAWKRWKSTVNPVAEQRRIRAIENGETGASISAAQRAKIFAAYRAAGGK